jgi:DNA (cytosine-5)-methyltransferase 1
MKKWIVRAADLFCGGGGTSTGLKLACEELGLDISLIAVNHWDLAIETHSVNHPDVKHVCDDLERLDPRKLVPSGKLRIMVASPECTHFSNARGGEPMSKQSRATIKHVIRWCSTLDIQDVLIENVREFMHWGPLHRKGQQKGRPIMARRGEYFRRFVSKLEKQGYRVEWRVLCAADYGDPTTRERLFIRARKGNKTILWPEATHSKTGGETFFGRVPQWVPAREIIDWSKPGGSIFNRAKPLAPNTLKRIEAGLRKFCGLSFVLPLEGFFRGNQPRSVDEPLPTIVASRGGGYVVNPFLVKLYKSCDVASIEDPLPTVTAQAGHLGLAQPFLVKYYRGSDAVSVDEPVPAVTANYEHMGLAQPFILGIRGGNDGYMRGVSVDEPVPAVTGHPALALVDPFIVACNHGKESGRVYSTEEPFPTVTSVDAWGVINPFIVQMDFARNMHLQSVDKPLGTITSADGRGLVTPFLIQYHGASYPGGDRVRSIDDPMATLGAQGIQQGLVQPFLVRYNGVGIGQAVDEPLGTVTGKDRFALVVPTTEGPFLLDILFRMLQPHELAAAMSFPRSYVFVGNREEKVKQIGNAVPVNLAKALCKAMLAK